MSAASSVPGVVSRWSGLVPRSAMGVLLRRAAGRFTTPLHVDDYLGLVNPLWSVSQLRGRVEEVRPETADAATVTIRPGWGWPGHRPGQHAGIGVDIEGVRHWRTFSMSSPPDPRGGRITFTVKALPEGFVSQYLVRTVRPGTIVQLGPPEGQFVLPGTAGADAGLLFWTAGSGITPVMAMLRHLYSDRTATGRRDSDLPDVVVLHSAPTPQDVIFGTELRELAARYPRLRLHEQYSRTDGRLTPEDLGRRCPDWRARQSWACGPAGLLEVLEAHWARAGVSDRLHLERFRLPRPTMTGCGGLARFTVSGAQARADGGTPLLEVGEAMGVLMPSGCRMGICYRCLAPLVSGRVRDLRTGRLHGEAGELIQTCVSVAAGDVEIDL
ncbi:MAG TPA: ferredoxin reductase [Kineosporiaceae bacterium]